jgi:rubrerythrin
MNDPQRKTFKNVDDMLELAGSIHRRLKDYYLEIKDRAENARVAMLLDYMGRHEKNIRQVLEKVRRTASKEVLAATFQFEPDELETLEDLTEWEPKPDMSVDEVVATALRFDSIMRDYYRRAAEMSASEQVNELFSNLVQLENRKRRRLVRDSLALKDL